MIAIQTAIATQHVERINLWYTVKPTGVYFDKIAPLVVLKDVALTEMPSFRGKTPTFQFTHMKDFIMWKILDEKGGIVLDLDTICIKDISDLMKDYLMTASLDVEDYKSIPFPFNSSVVMAVPGTHLTHSIRQFSDATISMDSIPWGLTGPIILSVIALQNLTRGFHITPHLVLNPFGGNEISAIYREDPAELVTLPKETRVVHLYSKAATIFDTIDAEWVRTSVSLLARLIREILPIHSWSVRAPWGEEAYLKQRGQHYADLFRVIREIEPRNILEIGTSSGQTAIGMIRTAGAMSEESAIAYFGVDLFESGKPSQWELEFTGGYIPPAKADVAARLKSETGADINLFAMDSRLLEDGLPDEDLLKMDLIFIDGGHSLDTVASDWAFAKRSMHEHTVVVFDDYFPELPFIGAKATVDSIDRNVYDVKLSTEIDDYSHPFGRLRTQLAVVTFKKAVEIPAVKSWAKDVLIRVLPESTRFEIMSAPGRISRGSNDR
jgi:hypothetical protein